MIALLGARLAGDDTVRDALRQSIATLSAKRAASGAIPNNVESTTGRPNFRAYADAGLWWIIGSALMTPAPATARAILHWYECQDVDQSGLVSMQEGADWQDLFCTRGKGLYLNCLYVLALRSAAGIAAGSEAADAAAYRSRAELAARRINQFFWYQGDGDMLRHVSHTFSTESRKERDSLGRRRWLPVKRQLVDEMYYLPYLGFRAAGEWFDSLGNLLAILTGVADDGRSQKILDFISRHQLDAHPLPALHPAVRPGDPDWRDYYGMLNVPGHYHNGGIWPFIGGFYVAALVHGGRRKDAERALYRLGKLNRAGNFNEWHSGVTAEPMGVEHQAWSAGMYLFAAECVRTGVVPPPFHPAGS